MIFDLIIFLSALAGAIHLARTRSRRAAKNRALVEVYCQDVQAAFARALKDKSASSALSVYKLLDESPPPVADLRTELREELRQLEGALKEISSWNSPYADPEDDQRKMDHSLRQLLVACSGALELERKRLGV